MLRHWVQVTGALALCSAAGMAAADPPPLAVDPFRLYGNQITFDVERDGDVVGQYVIDFTRTDQGVLAEARVDVDVSLLFVPVYTLATMHGSCGTAASCSRSRRSPTTTAI